MGERRAAPPWPLTSFVLDLDRPLGSVSVGDLLDLERRDTPVVGVVRGHCEGLALAAAFSVPLLVVGPQATFRARGPGTDLALRRAVDVVGRRVATYLAVATVGADDALAWGLATRLSDDPDRVAEALRRRVAGQASPAVAAILARTSRHAVRDHLRSRVTSPTGDSTSSI